MPAEPGGRIGASRGAGMSGRDTATPAAYLLEAQSPARVSSSPGTLCPRGGTTRGGWLTTGRPPVLLQRPHAIRHRGGLCRLQGTRKGDHITHDPGLHLKSAEVLQRASWGHSATSKCGLGLQNCVRCQTSSGRQPGSNTLVQGRCAPPAVGQWRGHFPPGGGRGAGREQDGVRFSVPVS